MRCTFVTQWFDPEPAAIRGLPLASLLVERGHDVEVVTGFPNYPGGKLYDGYKLRLLRRESVNGIDLIRVPLYPSHSMSSVRRVATYGSFAISAATIGIATARASDVVFVYHPPPTVGLAAGLWKLLRSTPFVYHIADMWPESVVESGMIRSAPVRVAVEKSLSWWCQQIYRLAEHITVLSPGFKRLLVERGVDEGKISVIYNWADESVFFPDVRDEALARSLGLDGRFVVLFAGNLGHYQSLDTAVRAAARLADRPGFELVFVGTGQAEASLRRLAAELRVQNVRFLPRRDQSEMNAVVNLADVMLVSLEDRPFFSCTIPSKTQVALAAGRPVVMAARGDAADLVEASGGGVVCVPGDDAALADAFDYLYSLPVEARAAMGRRGRAFYVSELSLEMGGVSTEQVLLRAAGAAVPG